MKKKIFLIKICLVFIVAGCFTACNDKIEDASSRESKGVSVFPLQMTVGQEAIISGPGFKSATEVVFPGGVSVTNIKKVGDSQLNVVVPSGTANNGRITVKLPDGDFIIPIDIMIVSTAIISVTSMEINPENGLYWVGTDDVLTVKGNGLGAISEIRFPGITVKTMDITKSDTNMELFVPIGINKVIAKLVFVTHSGQILESGNIDWTGAGYVLPELIPLCGRVSKVWSWNEGVKNCYGMGDIGETYPTWWAAPGGTLTFDAGEGYGATMTLAISPKGKNPKLIKRRTDGIVEEGTFTVDMNEKHPDWKRAIGLFSTKKVTVLCGRDTKNRPNIYQYWILKLTDTELVLGTADDPHWDEGWGQATLWLFKAVEPD